MHFDHLSNTLDLSSVTIQFLPLSLTLQNLDLKNGNLHKNQSLVFEKYNLTSLGSLVSRYISAVLNRSNISIDSLFDQLRQTIHLFRTGSKGYLCGAAQWHFRCKIR